MSARPRASTSLLFNFSLLTANGVVTPFASAALVLVISRLQGVEQLGRYSIIMAFFGLAQSCISLGLPVVVTRDVAQLPDRAARYLVNSTLVSLLLLLPILAILIPFELDSARSSDMHGALLVVCLALVPSIVTAYTEAILLALERPQDFVAIGFAENLCRTAAGIALVGLGHGIEALAVAVLVLRVAAAAASLAALRRRRIRLTAPLDLTLCRRLLRQVPVMGSIPLVTAIYWRSDILILTWFGGLAEVGYYSAAMRVLDMARSVPQALARASYPVLARLFVAARSEFRTFSGDVMRASILIMLALALALWAVCEPLVRLTFGPGFARTADVLLVVGWSIVPFALTIALAHVLFAAHRQAADLGVNIVATLCSIAMNLVVVPRYGSVGAAWTAVCSMLVHAALQYTVVRRMMAPKWGSLLARSLAAAALSLAAMHLVGDIHVVAKVLLGESTFVLACLGLGVVTRADVDFLAGTLRRGLPVSVAERC